MEQPTLRLIAGWAPIAGLPLHRTPEEEVALGLAARIVSVSVVIEGAAIRAAPCLARPAAVEA